MVCFFIVISFIFGKININGVNMKPTIIAKDTKHLRELIKQEIRLNGNNSDLNYIDVVLVTDMYGLFKTSDFNGDISQWDVSNVKDMSGMFCNSKFNGGYIKLGCIKS
jgi:uncharacterized protein YlaN (UPF0358 family)